MQVLVCDVVSGNVYPVIEEPLPDDALAALPPGDARRRLGSLLGRPSVPKYDAHFAAVELASEVPSGIGPALAPPRRSRPPPRPQRRSDGAVRARWVGARRVKSAGGRGGRARA